MLPGQGHYHDPVMLGPDGAVIERGGYVTDLITDDCIDFIDRDDGRPFLLLCHHKAAHRTWEPDDAHRLLYEDETIPEPPTFRDDLAGRADVVHGRCACGCSTSTRSATSAPPCPPGSRSTTRSPGATSGSSSATCASWPRSTTTSAGCSTTSSSGASPTARS